MIGTVAVVTRMAEWIMAKLFTEIIMSPGPDVQVHRA